jgi:hypothetical protein
LMIVILLLFRVCETESEILSFESVRQPNTVAPRGEHG